MVSYKGLNSKWFSEYVDREDRTVNIHIEVFDDLMKWLNKGEIKKQHDIPFIFTYWWLINYLWKYAKYGEFVIRVPDIKEMLNISPTTKTYDYIFKKGGLLDNNEWTDNVTNYPIAYKYDGHIEYNMIHDFIHSDDFERELYYQQYGKNYLVKKPLLAYERLDGEYLKEGTIWSKEDVFTLTFREFNECMSNVKLGILGFYLYSYIKWKYKMYGSSMVGITYKEFEKCTGYKERKIRIVLHELRDVGLIHIDSNTERRIDGIKTWNDYGIVDYVG